jgi:ribosomal protein S18 acetylase RimI-like enzyme
VLNVLFHPGFASLLFGLERERRPFPVYDLAAIETRTLRPECGSSLKRINVANWIVIVSETTFSVRRLSTLEADSFRSIRLESLQRDPEAFASTLARELSESRDNFLERFDRSTLFGGFVGANLMAIAGFSPLEGPKIGHKGVLWGMYTRPEARGTGLATALVGSLIEHAREYVEQIQLTVISSNSRARRFYQRRGFSEYGLEKKALKYNGVYFDEVLMVRFLNDGL